MAENKAVFEVTAKNFQTDVVERSRQAPVVLLFWAEQLPAAKEARRVLETLSDREARVLQMRFGIGDSSNHTLEEVGQDFEVTRERIRQIEAKALRKLRHPSRSKMLKGFIEN